MLDDAERIHRETAHDRHLTSVRPLRGLPSVEEGRLTEAQALLAPAVPTRWPAHSATAASASMR